MLMLLPLATLAQWTSRTSFAEVLEWHEYGGGVFCRCAHGAFTVDSDGEINTITRTSGLSSASLTASCADKGGRFWTLGYGDGSVDVCRNGRITNVVASPSASGAARAMACEGKWILVASGGGVSLVDAEKCEMYGYCEFGAAVESVALIDGTAYATAGGSAFSIDVLSPNFQNFGVWKSQSKSSVSQYFEPDTEYSGATPKGLPEDSVAAMSSMDGKMLAVNKFCTQVSRDGIVTFQNPDFPCGFTSVFFNPYNSAHYFLGGSDGSVYEYLNGSLKAKYDFCKGAAIVGMDCTEEGDLFVLSKAFPYPVAVFDHDGKWHNATSFKLTKSIEPKQILRVGSGQFWVNMGADGILAVDLNNTPLDFSDDKSTTLFPAVNGSRVGTKVTSMCVGEQGRVYVGGDRGVSYCSNPAEAADGSAKFSRPIITEHSDRDGNYSQYLLMYNTVNAIAVDAAGRKWFGTNGNGVFVVNEDADGEVMRFNTRNSPLPSDTVYAVEVVQSTGEVFFSTANGIASYISDAQKSAADLDDVLVYPNPVRPGYSGDVHISGLEAGCDVRITDVAGHLVYKGVADSGLLTWDCHNLNGNPCASGVYLIMVYNTDTRHKTVKKLLIVR